MNPFAQDPADAISSLGEAQLIRHIKAWLGDATAPTPEGIGDDCAVFSPSHSRAKQLITTDPVIYGYHFDDQLSPEQVAAKLCKRNLSDVAAMGGTPALATVSLALDPGVSKEWIERFYKGLASMARLYSFNIAGGDISSAPKTLGAFLTLVGETHPESRPLLRFTAKPQSPVYVTGELGGTRLDKHFSFEPRLLEGRWLAQRADCLSCTDVSDGIGKDHANLLPPGTALEIDCAQLPVADDARRAAEKSGKPPLYHVFNDGEDYELLFALAPDAELTQFERDWRSHFRTRLTRIGAVIANAGDDTLVLRNVPERFDATGYEHLR